MPCDGQVLEGVAAVDESMLTGESVLVAKRPGASVAGGTVVYEGPLTIRATATGAESTLAGAGWGGLAGGLRLWQVCCGCTPHSMELQGRQCCMSWCSTVQRSVGAWRQNSSTLRVDSHSFWRGGAV